MGGGGKGGSSVQTVSIPPEVLARYNAVNARAENVATTPFSPYATTPEAFVAPLSTSQQAGMANINALQGSANQAVGAGQNLQGQGVGTAQQAQAQAQGVNMAALQGISQAQQQGTAYNQAAGQNIGNAMGSAAPFMQGNAALQQQGLAQQQGYQQAATQNIGNAMGSASPYMQQMAGLTQAGLGAGQQYLSGATGLTQQAVQTGQQMGAQAQPFYTGALQAAQPFNQGSAQLTQNALQSAQPFNQQAQQYMGAGAQAVGPQELNYGQYMNPFLSNVVQAQQALQAQENAAQRSAMQGKAVQSGAFGGDRAGIEQANLARQQSLANQATLSNLLQSGFGQAQAAAQQQQGVNLAAAQANRAAQQQAAQQAAALGQQNFAQNLGAAQQAAALGQQNFAQNLGVGQGLAALGQQQYAQQLGAGAQVGQLGQQGFQQALGAGAQLGQVGQNLYNQNIGQGQALAGLGQQGLAALQGTGTNLGNIGQQLFGQNIAQGQAIQGLGQQQFAQGLAGAQGAANIGQNMFGQGAQTAGIQQAGGMNIANLGLQNQGAQIGAAQAQMAAGQQQQQTEQAARTALYNQYLQQQGYPFQIAQFLANIAEGTGSLSGSTTTAQRTGYRGGRMGDGYASGGLVPPNSQGGVVYNPGAYGRGGYADGGMSYDPDTNTYYQDLGEEGRRFSPEEYAAWSSNQDRSQQPAATTTSSSSQASTAPVNDKLTEAAKTDPSLQQNISDYQAVKGVNSDVASAFKDATGKDIDAASARKYQDMLNAGMSLDQVKYNINTSQPALLQKGDVGALKGQSLGYNFANFSTPSAPVLNQFGSYAAPAPQQASGKGASQPQTQNYYGGGYNQPSNYGMPNFGNYGGAPNYAGAAYYGGQQQYGYQPQYQQPQQASGKGASQPQPTYQSQPTYQPQPTYQAPQATGKGASQPAQQAPTATGKGMSTGGRAAFASGGRAGYAAGGDPSSVLRALAGQYDPGDPQGLVARQAAMFANAPGAAAGYVPQASAGAGQYKMMTPQASILPQKQNPIKEAASMGTSIASLGSAGGKLYDKLTSKPGTDTGADTLKEGLGNAADKTKNFFSGLFDSGEASGGRIGYSGGGIPGLDDLKQGYAAIPGGTGEDTPMGKVVSQGTQTPAELKGQMNAMSSGSGGLGGGSSSGGVGDIIKTGASLASLGNAAMSAGSWIGTNILPALFALKRGGRVGKAGGGALIHANDPKYHQMQVAFDNFVQRYDNNPLLAAAAMDVGPEVVDSAIKKAAQTGKDITDFLPRRTQEYMFALSKAAIGAHSALTRQERKSGGRTGYAIRGGVDDEPTGLAPAPSEAMTMDDVVGGLAPQGAGVQVASTEDLKNPDILRALRGVEGAKGDATAKNPNSTAGGLYQYVDSTWRKEAPLAGVDIKQYPTARSAPEKIQHKVADVNVSRILEQNKGNVQAVPNIWYSGNIEGKLSPEGLAANKGFTQEQYNQRFFNQLGGDQKAAPAPAVAPTQVAMASGLMPKTASDQPAPWETIGKKILPDAVPTDSSFWVPLIAGLGSMLASDEYRFSRRLGAGLVGGTSAYAAQQKIGAETELQRAQAQAQQASAFQTYSNIPKNAIFVQNGKEYVMLSSGQPMLMGQYLSLPQDKRPSIVGQQQLSVYGQPAVPGGAQPAAQKQEEKEAPLTAPKPGAVETQPLPAPSAAPAAPAKPLANVFTPTPEEAKEAHETTTNWANYGHQTKEPDFYTDQSVLASGAQKQKQILLPLASDMANLPKTGAGSSGPLQTYLNPIASYLNNLANIAGSPGLIVDPQVLADQEGVKKLVTQLQATATTTAGQHAFQAFKSMADGIPSLITSPEGQAKLLAQMMTNTQREIDKDNYFADYRKAAQGDKDWLADTASQTSRLANRNFDNRIGNKVYAEERDNLEKMFKQTVVPKNPDGSRGEPISVLALMTSGKPISDDFKKRIANKYGQNIFRYFGM